MSKLSNCNYQYYHGILHITDVFEHWRIEYHSDTNVWILFEINEGCEDIQVDILDTLKDAYEATKELMT